MYDHQLYLFTSFKISRSSNQQFFDSTTGKNLRSSCLDVTCLTLSPKDSNVEIINLFEFFTKIFAGF